MALANYNTKKVQFAQIIIEMIKLYNENPNHEFSYDVEDLQRRYCNKFLQELSEYNNKMPPKKKIQRIQSFYDKLISRTTLINDNTY